MKPKKEWHGKTGGGNLGQRGLFFYFRHGNVMLSYAVMGVAVFFYLIRNYKATGNIYYYFRKRQGFSGFTAAYCTYLNHFMFGKTLIDKFAIFAGRQKEYTFEVIGQELFDAVASHPETGAVVVNSHIGCAEIAGYLLDQSKKRFNAVVYGGEATTMQSYRSKILEEKNIFMIPVTDPFSHVFAVNNALKKGEIISMAGDRIYEGSKNITLDFLGAPARFPIGPFHLAVKMNVPVLVFFVMQNGYKNYKAFVNCLEIDSEKSYTINEKIESLTSQYVHFLEEKIKEYPLQWYNFHTYWV